MAGMLRLKRGEKSLGVTEVAGYATTTITSLAEANPYLVLMAHPPVVVVAAPQAFDVGVRTDIAAEPPTWWHRWPLPSPPSRGSPPWSGPGMTPSRSTPCPGGR